MFINGKKIIGSKVFTLSGYYLGRVIDFKLDTLSQNIAQYYVLRGFFNLFKKPLIIKSSQVIEIRRGKIIVEDTFVSAPGMEYAK